MDLKPSQLPGMAELLSPDEARDMDRLVPIKRFKKGTVLLKAGDVATASWYCLEGCVHMYYDVDGDLRTTEFFTEGQPVASLYSFINQVPANHYLACVEDCTLVVWSYAAERELFGKYPNLESSCRVSIESDFGAHQEKLAGFITKTPEQRYLDLMAERPDLPQRVPQYLLASYLGVTPESLSRIRKRIVAKEAAR
ncbi:MAG: Crp/Fnr family transcriptional regulator [Flavobacteriales bacterium]|nr:Crp/Fnr family transcriptional regulator [Flavobacteriales bacterium]MCB9166556.1 Crp/Fnr family transcriptional regulator [Flavobacteriales bacterium]